MGYSHMFYGLDLDRLQSVFGSGDEAFVDEVLKACAEEFSDNDEFFEEDEEEGASFNSEAALREIVAGSLGEHEGAEAVYGYVLKILCEHLGEPIGDDVAAIRDHRYDSQLVAAGPPIPIPNDECDFPEIGFLSLADIPAEIARIDKAPNRAKRRPLRIVLLVFIIKRLTGFEIGRQMDSEEIAEDMAAYRETLEEARDKGLSIVSFRH